MERTHLECERLVFFELDQQDRLLAMRPHDFALRISMYMWSVSPHPATGDKASTVVYY